MVSFPSNLGGTRTGDWVTAIENELQLLVHETVSHALPGSGQAGHTYINSKQVVVMKR